MRNALTEHWSVVTLHKPLKDCRFIIKFRLELLLLLYPLSPPVIRGKVNPGCDKWCSQDRESDSKSGCGTSSSLHHGRPRGHYGGSYNATRDLAKNYVDLLIHPLRRIPSTA